MNSLTQRGLEQTGIAQEPFPSHDPDGEAPGRLTGPYVVGLSAVALLAIVAAVLVGRLVLRQGGDASSIGVAANQSILSYELTEAAAQGRDISDDAATLRANHLGLLLGNPALGLPRAKSAEIQDLLDGVSPLLTVFTSQAAEVAAAVEANGSAPIDALAAAGERFRFAMGTVILQYQREAEARVLGVQRSLIAVLAGILALLFLEGLFLFGPAERRARRRWQEHQRRTALERARHQQALELVSRTDPLTGLPNRAMAGDLLGAAVARARREGTIVAALVLDIDNFKAVNNQYGEAAGDAVLRTVGERLVFSLRQSDTVAALGSDQFAVVLEGAHKPDAVASATAKMLETVRRPIQIGNTDVAVTASAGVVMYPADGDQSDALLWDATLAMYAAKERGGNTFEFFTQDLRAETSERLRLIDELRRALHGGEELRLVYQPKIDIRTGAIIGVEALARWRHPRLGDVPPSRFIPLAEESELIVAIGEWVIDVACAQAADWRASGYDELKVSVNLSPRQLRRGDLVETVSGALERSGLDPRWLELEITEGMLAEDSDRTRATFGRLKAMGVRVSIDDFGTGYSSLAYLKRFPVDTLKIDRSFVSDLTGDPDSSAIPAAVVGLGRSLRLHVIAEGVERPEQLEQLRRLGCDAYQGFLMSRPLEAADIPGLIVRLAAAA